MVWSRSLLSTETGSESCQSGEVLRSIRSDATARFESRYVLVWIQSLPSVTKRPPEMHTWVISGWPRGGNPSIKAVSAEQGQVQPSSCTELSECTQFLRRSAGTAWPKKVGETRAGMRIFSLVRGQYDADDLIKPILRMCYCPLQKTLQSLSRRTTQSGIDPCDERVPWRGSRM